MTDLSTDAYAPDGSPVPLYQRLPPRTADADHIHQVLPGGASVLDLGCGTGRLAEPLAALGHPVTGVDNEPQMLAALRHATGVTGDLTTIELGLFEGVLLMSHLVNSADTGFVTATLRTVRRHLQATGIAVVERFPPGWVDSPTETAREQEGVRYTLRRHRLSDDGVLTASIGYEFDGLRAVQRFAARDVDDARLAELAAAVGLRVDGPLVAGDDRVVLLRPVA